MFRLIPILIIIIDAVVIFDILKSSKSSEKKLIWILAVIFLPVLGPLLYYVIEKK